MNREIAKKLNDKAKAMAWAFSKPEREFNGTNESFEVHKINPLSEDTAAVTYNKSSGKKALMFFYYRKNGGGNWHCWFPTDSHILGMQYFGELKLKVEVFNFDKNEM
ncbi:hypothetical protein K8R33_02840 [archaeon]|nr:hypothetical protein [archaeon]